MRSFHFIWIMMILAVSFSCTSTSSQQTSPKNLPAAPQTPASGDTDTSKSDFILGPGDELDVSVWRNDDLDQTLKIDPSGYISMPLAGDIYASGLTTSELKEKITKKLEKYIVDPFVTINIESVSSSQIYVLGEINSPGSFAYTKQVPAWEAVASAGGFTEDANEKKLLRITVKDGIAEVALLELDFEKIYEDGQIKGDYYLRNGDILYVPETQIASIEEFMNRLNNIITPIYTLQRMIMLIPNLSDALKGVSSGNVIAN